MHGVAVCDIRQAWRASEPGEPRNKLRKPPAPHSRFRARRERPRAKQAPGRLRAGCGRQPDPLRPGVRPSHSRSTSRQAAPPDALPCTPAQTQPRCLRASRPRNAERSRVGQRESSLMVKRPPAQRGGIEPFTNPSHACPVRLVVDPDCRATTPEAASVTSLPWAARPSQISAAPPA